MLLIFLILWLTLCGGLTLETVAFSLVVTAALFWFCCRFLGWSWKWERLQFRLLLPELRYILLLIREIVKANLIMLRLLLSGDLKGQVRPVLVRMKVPLRTGFARMMLANSITLTPGTITVEQRGTEYVIHCLNRAFSQDLDCSVFVQALGRIEALALGEKEGRR